MLIEHIKKKKKKKKGGRKPASIGDCVDAETQGVHEYFEI